LGKLKEKKNVAVSSSRLRRGKEGGKLKRLHSAAAFRNGRDDRKDIFEEKRGGKTDRKCSALTM